MGVTWETLTTGLHQPEGPDILDDGVVFVESLKSRVVTWSARRGLIELSHTGGGPNAAKVGSDGAVYVTQNGGAVPGWESPHTCAPSIQRIGVDGRCEEVVTAIDGVALQYPNDLAFGADGRLYFTDPPAYLPDHRGTGRVWALESTGRGSLIAEVDGCFPNGIAGDRDGSIVWVDSFERNIHRWRPGTGSTTIAQLAPGHIPDGLDIDVDGNLWIASVMSGGIDVLTGDGEPVEFIPLVGWPLNCTFWDSQLVVTASGGDHRDAGALLRVPVGVVGMTPFRGTVTPVA